MTRNAGNWKAEWGGQEIPILADLSIENCVDELFRPYLPGPAARQPARVSAPAVTPSRQRTATGPIFDVVVRSGADLWPPPPDEALVLQGQAQALAQPHPPEAAPRPENFAALVVPKTATTTPPPLPHEVREELLELRTEVMHAIRTQRLQTLMICGVEAGAGTSFVAGHLTRILAEYAQMKVAFLTLVPRREKRMNRLARGAAPTRLQFLLRRTELPNLAEIASANGAISLTELLCNCSTAEVLRQMKAEFDLIVIDAPAIAMYGEAALLAALMDGVILVAEPDVTPLRRLDRAHRRLRKARAKVLGMVFNRKRRL